MFIIHVSFDSCRGWNNLRVRSVSDELSELEEIQLASYCISRDAVEILRKNINSNFKTEYVHFENQNIFV